MSFTTGSRRPKWDLVGLRFGNLLVTALSPNKSKGERSKWRCLCDCGEETHVRTDSLRSGHTTSCGCQGCCPDRTHGKSHSPEYMVWEGMIARTTNPKSKSYKNYGAKGITVCERWLNFEGFWEDMGERPSENHSLDRIDSSKGYFKENCRWATIIEQNNNTSRNRFLDFEGRRQTLTQWAREMGLSPVCLIKRINTGWTIERALNTPSSKKKFEHA